MVNASKLEMFKQINNFVVGMSETFFKSAEIQNFLNDDSEKFDAIILEYVMNEFMLG